MLNVILTIVWSVFGPCEMNTRMAGSFTPYISRDEEQASGQGATAAAPSHAKTLASIWEVQGLAYTRLMSETYAYGDVKEKPHES